MDTYDDLYEEGLKVIMQRPKRSKLIVEVRLRLNAFFGQISSSKNLTLRLGPSHVMHPLLMSEIVYK